MIVNVIPQPGQPVERRKSQGPNGETIMDMVLGEVEGAIESGRFDKANLGRYAQKPTVKRR